MSEIQWVISVAPPFDWRGILSYLRLRAIPGVEWVDERRYRRTVTLGKRAGWIDVKPYARSLEITTVGLTEADRESVTERVRALFDTRFRTQVLSDVFAEDAVMGPALRRWPGIRVPGCWDGFELTVRTIAGQQVSVQGASTVTGRIAAGHRPPGSLPVLPAGLDCWFPNASVLVSTSLEALAMPRARAQAMVSVAQAVDDGTLTFEPSADPSVWINEFTRLKGIGPWTASYVAMRALGFRDAFPAGDLALQRAANPAGPPLTAAELESRSRAWSPWRSYAAALLWKCYGDA
ncbi:MAG: AlkA N-terminal domain-containing protein [Pseudomonadota bacterium]